MRWTNHKAQTKTKDKRNSVKPNGKSKIQVVKLLKCEVSITPHLQRQSSRGHAHRQRLQGASTYRTHDTSGHTVYRTGYISHQSHVVRSLCDTVHSHSHRDPQQDVQLRHTGTETHPHAHRISCRATVGCALRGGSKPKAGLEGAQALSDAVRSRPRRCRASSSLVVGCPPRARAKAPRGH